MRSSLFIEGGRGGWVGHSRASLRTLERKKYKLHVRVFLSKYRGYATCPDCRGQRLRAEARAVLLEGHATSARLCALTITEAETFFDGLKLSRLRRRRLPAKFWKRCGSGCIFWSRLGLEYLTLDRLSSTLSGGESQRIQLATSLGSRLVGALYVLDEPSIGSALAGHGEADHDHGRAARPGEHDPCGGA